MDINRHSSKVPEYDQVFLENPEIRSVKSSEVRLPWETFGDDACNTTIQVDAVVTSGVTLYESTSRVSDHSSQWFRLRSAHFTFDASEGQPYEVYSFIIDYMTVDYSVREVNEYLRKKGIPPLSMPNTR